MTLILLVILTAAWIGVFWPAVRRAKFDAPLSSAERFRRRLDLIAPKATQEGRWIVMPESRDRLQRAAFRRGQQRRARILVLLAAAVVATLLLALVAGGAAWEVQLACDASLTLYVFLLLDAKKRRTERTSKVRRISKPKEEISESERVDFYAPANERA